MQYWRSNGDKPVEPGAAMVVRVGPAEHRYPEFASPPRANSAKGTPGPLRAPQDLSSSASELREGEETNDFSPGQRWSKIKQGPRCTPVTAPQREMDQEAGAEEVSAVVDALVAHPRA